MHRAFLVILILLAVQTSAIAENSALKNCLAKQDLSEPACNCIEGCAIKGKGCKDQAKRSKNSEEITNARCNSITELCQSQCIVAAEGENRTTRSDVLAAVAAQALHLKEHGTFLTCANSECLSKLKGVEFQGQTDIAFEALEGGQVLVGRAHSRAGTDLRYTYDSRRDHPKLLQHHEGESVPGRTGEESQSKKR